MKSAAQASDKPTSASSYSSTLSASSTRLTVLGHQSAENARTPGQLWHIHLKQANPCFLLFRHPYGYMWIQSLSLSLCSLFLVHASSSTRIHPSLLLLTFHTEHRSILIQIHDRMSLLHMHSHIGCSGGHQNLLLRLFLAPAGTEVRSADRFDSWKIAQKSQKPHFIWFCWVEISEDPANWTHSFGPLSRRPGLHRNIQTVSNTTFSTCVELQCNQGQNPCPPIQARAAEPRKCRHVNVTFDNSLTPVLDAFLVVQVLQL